MEFGECSTSMPPQAKRHRGNPFDGIMPSPPPTFSAVMKKRPCDVFINHRGCDTKHTLASAIYHTLDMNNIHAFLDVEDLELGDSFPDELEEAMRTAGVHIALFSERYAKSAWCLAELSYMLQTGTPIIPIFYHVDTSDLRWVAQGKGCYAPAFSQHEEKGRYPSNLLDEWKEALQRVSYLQGHVLNKNIGDEGMLLKSIVNSVFGMLRKVPLEVAKHPVGMDEIVQDFERSRKKCLENEKGVQIVGIIGLGGSGKTTLATEVYNRKKPSINHSSFLHDVRDAASRNVLHTKQKKLLEDVLNQTESFDNVKEGKAIIAHRLRDLSVLIVLDDVDHEDQLDALLPPKERLGRGSLVIITTRQMDVLTKWDITSIYKAKPLQDDHAKQLFCWHAFLQPFPLQGFQDLVESFVNCCSGLPLSLKVIGGQLYGKRSREYWVSQLKKIQRILPNEILERLKVSYDALDEEEQEMFLDIACHLIGERKSMAIEVWDASGRGGLCSWEALQNKCLVESYKDVWEGKGKEKRIWMHDHLRDLGRLIAKTRSRPRILVEVTPFRGIADSEDRRVKFESCRGEAIESTEKWVELLRGLLWLQWGFFEDTSIPPWLPLDTIIVLEIFESYCLETLWDEARPPLRLRELRIECASNLQSLPRSIGRLQHLKTLSLRNDLRLSSLPEEFSQLHLLEHLDLQRCQVLASLPNRFGDLVNLRHLDLNYCRSLKRLPESFKELIHLQYLDLNDCESLESLNNIPNLKAVYIIDYDDITDLSSMGQLSLNFSGRCIGKLLPIICQLSELKELVIIDDLYKNYLDAYRSLPIEISQMYSLQILKIRCGKLYEISNLAELVSLTTLEVECCDKLQKIEISHMPSLQNLTIKGCEELNQIVNLAGMGSLTNLEVENCNNLQKFEISQMFSLQNLEVKDCENLQIEGLEHLTSLKSLVVWSSWWMEDVIDSLQGLDLQTLNLSAFDISNFGPCVQNIEMKNWPWEMTICGQTFSHDFESILNLFRFRGVDVHRIREFVQCHETNLSNAALICYLLQCQDFCRVRIGKAENTCTGLWEGRWIVMSVFKEVSCHVEDRGGGLNSLEVLDSKDEYWKSVEDGEGGHDRKVDVLAGWVMVGDRECILYAFKQLFQTFSDSVPC